MEATPTPAPAAAESDDGRPSFASFLKKAKQKEKSIGSASGQQWKHDQDQDEHSSGSRSEGTSSKPLTASQKSKLRRAQVRKAQIQHRQRKAEYVKQLELDVSHFRELVSLTELEADELRKENEAIRSQLQAAGVSVGAAKSSPAFQTAPSSVASHPEVEPRMAADVDVDAAPEKLLGGAEAALPQAMDMDQEEPQEAQDRQRPEAASSMLPQQPIKMEELELYDEVSIDDVVVSLKRDEDLGTPVLSISSTSSPETLVLVRQSQLSAEQEQMAINFILSLEHICWNHFFLGDHPHHSQLSDDAKGHALMVSSICMTRAPEPVYLGRAQITAPTSPTSPTSPTAAGLATTAAEPPLPEAAGASSLSPAAPVSLPSLSPPRPPTAEPSAPSTATALACTLRSTCSPGVNGGPPVCFSWPAPPLSLGALRGLANSLTVGVSELTPVQAWFELAERFPPAVLLHPSVQSALIRELNTVVQCLKFGAVMDREAFERAVKRVLGSSLEGMMARFAIEQRRHKPGSEGMHVLAN